MYRGFNICDVDLSDKYLESGKEMLNTHKKVIIRTLDNYVNDEGRLDGSLMQSSWFPTISTDVFISHSHSDEAQAIALAGALYDEFGLISFVDSCVWGYANNLLKQIDKIYCPTGRGTYDYDLRNRSTSHVHMMLASALSMMIDRAECLFFLNTPKSLSSDDVIKKTMSPWIYYELMAFKYIKKPDRPRPVTRMLLDEQVIEKLENGYDTIISAEHKTLSIGQKQRIAIARAIIKKSKVLILDEPTANLDSESEKLIIESLIKLKDEMIIILIAHKESIINMCDKIYQISNGKIAEVSQKHKIEKEH